MNSPIRVAHVCTIAATVRHLLLDQLVRQRGEGFDVCAISAPGRSVPEIEAHGIRHIAWPHATRSWAPGADARAFRALIRILRRERIDLVHTHNVKPGLLGRIAARAAGVPLVVNTVHGLYATPDDPFLKRTVVLGLERLAAGFSDLELYQSKEDLEWARRIGLVSRARSAHIGSGADLTRFDPAAISGERIEALRRELGIPPGAPVVGTACRLVAEKGVREFFTAARSIRASLPEVKFVMVGFGDPAKGDAIPRSEIDRARETVVITGWRDDVDVLLALMDVFVLASHREGLPRSAIEAAAMGKALVLTDVRGCREVVTDGVDGVLVPPRDPESLAGAIADLIRDPEARTRFGKAAREGALERFDGRKVADLIVDEYRRLLIRTGRFQQEPGPYRIRRALPGDAPALARLHRTGLPDAFLSALGERFLRRLYRAMASDRDAFALVAVSGGAVVGFVSGTLSGRRFYRRFLLRHGVIALMASLPALVRPGTLKRVREIGGYAEGPSGLPEAELTSAAILPGWRGQGLGTALYDAGLRLLMERGAPAVRGRVLVTNEGGNRVLARLGFRHVGTISVHWATPDNVWIYP